MSGQGAPSGSGAGPSSSIPKAISSLAKKQADVTRQGTQKLKFVPTLPARRKKDEVKPEPVAHTVPSSDRGRGRGRGEGRGRGRGGPRPPVEMTASGPFAMGPAMAGNTSRRAAPRSNFAPIRPTGPVAALGAGLSRTSAPSLKKEKEEASLGKGKDNDDDAELYSDPDEGVEIVDMEDVRQMDWMAPESLRKDKSHGKKKKLRVKNEEVPVDSKGKGRAETMDVDEAAETGEVDLANALDLSDSEEEEELEDLMEDFALDAILDEDPDVRQERLYFFQFPSPFPTFVPKKAPTPIDVDDSPVPETTGKKVTFAPDVKPPGSVPGSSRASAAPSDASGKDKSPAETKVDGIIGQLEIYQSGTVKMRLANGIVLDVLAATQPSFLQQAVHLDMEHKRLTVLGEVNKRFVVSPNVESLLSALDVADRAPRTVIDGEEDLITMDTT